MPDGFDSADIQLFLQAIRQKKLTRVNNINNTLHGNGLINCKVDGSTVNVIQVCFRGEPSYDCVY